MELATKPLAATGTEEMTSEQVVTVYGDMVYRLAFSIVRSAEDANDVFQEVFLRYIREPAAFADEEHRKRWLMRVTVNCCKSMFRSAYRRHAVPLEDNTNEATAPDSFDRLEAKLDIEQAMAQLKPDDRTLLHLFYFEDCPIARISAILERPAPLVKVQLSRARAKLKTHLKGVYQV